VLASAVDHLRVERIVAGFAIVIEDLGKTLQMLGSATDFQSCSVETRIGYVRQFTPYDRGSQRPVSDPQVNVCRPAGEISYLVFGGLDRELPDSDDLGRSGLWPQAPGLSRCPAYRVRRAPSPRRALHRHFVAL
jgi:hypothetical protein